VERAQALNRLGTTRAEPGRGDVQSAGRHPKRTRKSH